MANQLTVFGAIRKAATKSLANVAPSRGWWPMINEPFTGAWQRNKEEKLDTLVEYPTLYACLSRITTDVGKLPPRLMSEQSDGTRKPTPGAPVAKLLRRPNHYQTSQQFLQAWVMSKLTQGNTYVLIGRGALYVLDPYRVMPLVSESGDVYYQLYDDPLNRVEGSEPLVVPARDIIHDRCICPFHPLIGLPPVAAANWAALKNMRILRSSAEFFGNGAQPSGILSAPGAISDETANRLSNYWNDNFTGKNAGRVAVVGDALKFESLAAKSVDSQMVEQLRYSDEQICQPFGIPPFKVGIGTIPAGMKVDDINQLYYSDALQTHIESIENLLDLSLGIPDRQKVELDLYPLLRMDEEKRTTVEVAQVSGAIKAPNEARRAFNLAPKEGGDAIYLQQQNYSLEALARRDAQLDPFNPTASEPPPPVEPEDTQERAALETELWTLKALSSAREALR